jgi:hypothetical protein
MNETIFVLGLGETLKFFKDFDKPKIGVNDIWSRVKTEMVVCIDRPEKFETQRLEVIKNCKPEIFFTYTPEWKKYFNESYFWKAPIVSLKTRTFDNKTIFHSNNSTFVACSIAYLLGTKNIVIYGADFISHKKLKGASTIQNITKDFAWLRDNLKDNGVNLYVGHQASRLHDVLPLWSRPS